MTDLSELLELWRREAEMWAHESDTDARILALIDGMEKLREQRDEYYYLAYGGREGCARDDAEILRVMEGKNG